ncbi:hypothetical protein NTGBS_170004 [Candidatus Nitrotoga sp. BS]|nr:hypothetical protein NTGBS_170004 [Candidatus Nitrotoga sp. BS]
MLRLSQPLVAALFRNVYIGGCRMKLFLKVSLESCVVVK